MKVFRVGNPGIFDEAPESAMNLHLAVGRDGRLFVVVGCLVGIPWESIWQPNEMPYPLKEIPWLGLPMSNEARRQAFDEWLSRLEPRDDLQAYTSESVKQTRVGPTTMVTSQGYIVGPLSPLPPPPKPPASIYGHLPFGAMTGDHSVFYRWEAFPPPSRKIIQNGAAGSIKADTFAAPPSELPMVPTGFAAVARYALPSLWPACFRWEIRPEVGKLFECGASVPLYGQSGGGVEVRFPKTIKNRGPIADPVILPVM